MQSLTDAMDYKGVCGYECPKEDEAKDEAKEHRLIALGGQYDAGDTNEVWQYTASVKRKRRKATTP